MRDKVGEIAGEVYRLLDEEGSLPVSKVGKNIEAPRSKVNMGIGWLSKEGKLEFDEEGRSTEVSLK
jgi:hypothetical protein